MRLITRLGTTLTAAVIAVGGLTLLGGSTAQATGGHCGYPPGQCGIGFAKSTYFPGQDVTFTTDRAFGSHETVDGFVDCAHGFSFSIGPFHANGNHRVNATFHLPKNTPAGTCNVVLYGKRTGYTATGGFDVRHRHH